MKAFVKKIYGGPEVLKLEEIDKPFVKKDHLLIRVMANSANAADWHILRGKPILARFSFGLFKPKKKTFGADFAGVVEEIGEGITDFKVGDKVFGETLDIGSFSEYTCVNAKNCARIPDEINFNTMASLPIAAITAFQAVTTHGKIQKGETVLVNGSSGGVGHFTVQIAKAFGANVTGVCSSRNRDLVKSLGADRVITYDTEDIKKLDEQFDVVIDTHGNLNFKDFKRLGRRGVLIGFTTMGCMISVVLKSSLTKYPLAQFTAEANREDLETIANLVKENRIKPHISKVYSYKDIPEAIRYIEEMHTSGKVVMEWE